MFFARIPWDIPTHNDLSNDGANRSEALELRLKLEVSLSVLAVVLAVLKALVRGNGWCLLICPSGFGRFAAHLSRLPFSPLSISRSASHLKLREACL